MINKIKLQLLDTDGNVVQESETHNTMTPALKDMATAMYVSSLNYGDTSGLASLPTNTRLPRPYDSTFLLMDDTYGLMGNGYVSKMPGISRIGSVSVTPASAYLSSAITAYCEALSTTNTGSKGGSYLPSASGVIYNADGSTSYKYVWEWATTQGNGVIKSIGMFTNNTAFTFNLGAGLSIYSNKYMSSTTGNMVGAAFLGWKIDGSDKLLYYRDVMTEGNNNINIYRWSNNKFILPVETVKVLNISGSVSVGTNLNSTAYCNGYFYTVTAASNSSITFKKADETTLAYGSPITRSFTAMTGNSNAPTWVWSDQRYVYIAKCSTGTGAQAALIKIDTTDDSVTINILTAALTGQWGQSDSRHAICPFTGSLFLNEYSSQQSMAASMSPSDINNMVHIGALVGIQLFVVDGRLVQPGVRYRYAYLGNYLSYAELSSPITKTSQNSLRVEYTFTHTA